MVRREVHPVFWWGDLNERCRMANAVKFVVAGGVPLATQVPLVERKARYVTLR